MPHLSLHFLGTFHVQLRGEPVTAFESDNVRALLAYLAVEAGRPHGRAALAGLLWPELPEPAARQNLRQALYNLRRAIGDRQADPAFLHVSRESVQFNRASDHWLDVIEFSALLDACETHRHRRLEACKACLGRLGEAVELYRGSFLEGFFLGDSTAFEEWALVKREGLHRQALAALGRVAAYHVRRGEYEQASRHARRQVALEPWGEEAHRQLMRALALDGQRSAALQQYETCRRALAEELGVEPAEETTALYEQIRDAGSRKKEEGRRKEEGAVPSFLLPASLPARHNLPVQATAFVGREAELARIGERLNDPDCRLLTLIGPGGIGKTRLALQAAAEEVHGYAHGVFFVPLAPVSASGLLVVAIADALNLSFGGREAPRVQLLNHLREKEMLLVLDNFEHLLGPPCLPPEIGGDRGGAGAGLLAEVLARAPGVQLLVTTRERLNLGGEWLLAVPGLPFPEEGGRNGEIAGYSAVQLFLQSARRVALDFSPGEAEMGFVARICRLVEGLPLGIELAAAWVRVLSCEEIVREIERKLDFLATSLRDVPERHRSLRAVFDHSWKLLAAQERAVLKRLSVFRGGFRREAASQIAGASLSSLSALVDKSFIRRTPAGPYEIHELLREYAGERLAEEPDALLKTETRHGHYYARFLRGKEADLHGPQQHVVVNAIRQEFGNIQAGWNRAVARTDTAVLDDALEGLLLFLRMRGRFREAHALCARTVDALRKADGRQVRLCRGRLLAYQGYFSFRLGRFEEAGKLLDRSLAICRPLGEEKTVAFILNYQALAAQIPGVADYATAVGLFQESLAIYRRLGDRTWISGCLNNIGLAARDAGRYEEARQYLQESVAIARQIGNRYALFFPLNNLGYVAYQLGDYPEAEQYGLECLQVSQEIDNRYGIAGGHGLLGRVYIEMADYQKAIGHLQDSLELWQQFDSGHEQTQFTTCLSRAYRLKGESQRSLETLRKAMRRARELDLSDLQLEGVAEMAHHLQETGQLEQATAYVTLVLGHRDLDNLTLQRARSLHAQLETELPAEAVAAAMERGKALQLEEVVAEILGE